MESIIPKWTKVTVYQTKNWVNTKIPIECKGYLLRFNYTENDTSVQIITENGQVIAKHFNCVKFHLGEVFDPNKKKDLIPEGTRVICYEDEEVGLVESCRANFLRFGNDYDSYETGPGNYTSAVVLKDDGLMESFHVVNVRICTEEEEKEENPILNRLRAINE